MQLVNINGTIVEPEKAKISVFDRGFLFGDSIYEVTRTYQRKIFLWQEHWDRMQHSASKIGMKLPITKSQLLQEIRKLLKSFDKDNVYVRWVLTRGEGEIGLDPALAEGGNFVIFVRPLEENPSWWYKKGVSILISGVRRNDRKALDPNVKSGNYLNNLMAIKEAKEQGFFDAIMLNKEEAITEGTTFNFWIVKGKTIQTPPMESGILRGITREKLKALIRKSEFHLEEKVLYPEEAYEADECFITSATKELIPVVQLDSFSIGKGVPGPLFGELHQLFKKWRDQRLEEDNLSF